MKNLLKEIGKESFVKHLTLEGRTDLLDSVDDLVDVHIMQIMNLDPIKEIQHDIEQVRAYIDDYVEDRVYLIVNGW